jgi:hypothetical protein
MKVYELFNLLKDANINDDIEFHISENGGVPKVEAKLYQIMPEDRDHIKSGKKKLFLNIETRKKK